ncbi:hypothetical protein H4R19_004528 [Coemansia spiralis]|nr:hypothetical protein H4R19_004528 [Coemansia spiralis]
MGDVALSLVRTLQHQQPAAALSVADYAALFPDIAAALASPVESCPPFLRSPAASSADLAAMGLAGIIEPVSPAASLSESYSTGAQSPASETADGAEEQRKRRDREFLASLPPQLALKRRRTSNNKQKDKILAELLQPADACPIDVPQPATPPAQPAAADDSEASGSPGPDGELGDAAALKRKKNTDAARRSRMRKILRIETLESRVSELEGENTRLAQLVAQLEAEKAAMARGML